MPSNKTLSDWERAERIPVDEKNSGDPVVHTLLSACRAGTGVDIVYYGGEFPGVARKISPRKVFRVRGFDQIYVEAYCHTGKVERNFRIDRLKLVTSVHKGDTYRASETNAPEKSLGAGCLLYVVGGIVMMLLAFGAVIGMISF